METLSQSFLIELTENQILIRDTIRDFAKKKIKPKVMEWDEVQHFPIEIFRELGELGFAPCHLRSRVSTVRLCLYEDEQPDFHHPTRFSHPRDPAGRRRAERARLRRCRRIGGWQVHAPLRAAPGDVQGPCRRGYPRPDQVRRGSGLHGLGG